jgi:hypothetical protein
MAMISFNVPMIRRMLLRLAARRFVSIYELAKSVDILCPAETAGLPSAVYPEGSLDKIIALSPWRTWEQEHRLIRGGKVALPPSHAYLVSDVDIVDTWLYAGAAKDNPGYGSEKFLLKQLGPRQELAVAHLVTTVGGSHFFGALLLDDFVIELNADNSENNIRMVTKTYGHEHGYRQMLGLPFPPVTRHARVAQLTVYTEPSNNSFRATRYRLLRERLRQNFNGKRNCSAVGVYLKRGGSGEKRILENEPEIEAFLVEIGFDIVEPAELTVEEIVSRTMDIGIVVSVEGSHMSHTQYTMKDDATFVVLQPPDRFSTVYKEFTDCMGMQYAFLVGDKTEKGFTVSIDELQQILDRIA